MRRTLLLLILSLVVCGNLFAQPGKAPTRIKDGKVFYVHEVEPGNTLYGLHRIYGVDVEQIMFHNPFLKDGLKVGQEVLIPKEGEPETVEVETSKYKVRKGETLYGISRKFNCSVDQLIEMNPELKDGLKKGQIIQVPGKSNESIEEYVTEIEPLPNPFVVDTLQNEEDKEKVTVSFSDSIVEHKVLAHETMYSISKRFMVPIEMIMRDNNLTSTSLKEGQILRIPIKQERIEKTVIKPVPPVYNPDGSGELVFDRKDNYKVAVLAPFFLDYGKGYSKYVSGLAADFYMGAKIALDSLERRGLNAEVFFFDTKNDSSAVVGILEKAEFVDMDLVIGPFFPKPQRIAADFCKQNKVRMVVPVSVSEDLIEKNRLVYGAVPGGLELIDGIVDHIAEKYTTANVVVLQVKDESDKVLFEEFKRAYSERQKTVNMSNLSETTVDGLKYHIQRGKKNVYVVLTKDKNLSMKFMNSLDRSSFRAKSDDMLVFGLKEWLEFEDVNSVYRDKYNFHFPSTNHLDYYRDDVIEFNKLYRRAYKTDLSRMAVQAYDIVTYFCSSFFLEQNDVHLFMNDFQIIQSTDSSGYQNNKVFIIEQEDFELIER
jgi:LysM repeat protein